MKITTNWLKEHLDTKLNENQIIDKLTDVGLEVEGVDSQPGELDEFVIAKILKAEKHPDADRLKVCDVDIGSDNPVKVVCGAPNAKEGLMTIYAPPGAVVPKSQMKLVVSKIRGVTSYGMLCSESELNLSNESDGITELSSKKYEKKIGENYFPKSSVNVIDISITPNRADCLGVRGIARDLATAGSGTLKKLKTEKLVKKNKQKVSIKIIKEKNQGCTSFGSCLITGVKNTESPDWLKKKIISLGQKPISAIVDITNYVMIDLNRPLHAYDADKIDKGIIVRNSKKGEKFKALDEKDYNLEDGMCVITDASGVLGLGGIIGGTRSGTELDTKNVLIESAYFSPRSIRKSSKILNIDTDAKFRFERGIDPLSIEQGLEKAASLIQEICGGKISQFDVQKIKDHKKQSLKFDPSLFEKITGIEIENSEAALEAERNLNNILNNELKKKELIIDSLRAESNKNHIFKGEEAYAVVNKLTSAHSKFYKNYKGNETYETREQERERLESLLYSYHTCLGYFYNYDESHFTHYKNIKNDKVYSTFKSFKYLVDTIYKLGFKICMDEGIYYVDEDSKDCTTECDGCD